MVMYNHNQSEHIVNGRLLNGHILTEPRVLNMGVI